MGDWLFGFAKRYVLFTVFTIGLARAYSWLLGYDDEMKMWASQNRLLIVVTLVVAGIAYAMYDWLRSNEP